MCFTHTLYRMQSPTDQGGIGEKTEKCRTYPPCRNIYKQQASCAAWHEDVQERQIMIVLTAEALRAHIAGIPGIRNYKRRFCYDKFRDLVVSTRDMKVVALHGLKNTGKKVLMAQLIMDIGQYDNICLIRCTADDDMDDLRKAIETHSGCTYFFVDEAPVLKDFSIKVSELSDIYSAGRRIVLSGTNSQAFYIARRCELYGKIHMIHTTWIPYREYSFLLGRSLDDYIQHGGTLTPDNDFCTSEAGNAYVKSAIIGNILNSKDLARRDFGGVFTVYRYKNKLGAYLARFLDLYMSQLAVQVIKHCMSMHSSKDKDAYCRLLSSMDDISIKKGIIDAFDLSGRWWESEVDEGIACASAYLEASDVMYPVPDTDEAVFTQPGLRYSQCTAQIRLLMQDCHKCFSEEQLKKLSVQLGKELRKRLLEDIVWCQLFRAGRFRDFEIARFRSPHAGGETAFVLSSRKANEACIIALSHSDRAEDMPLLHLDSKSLRRKIWYMNNTMPIGRLALYRGKPLKEKQHGAGYANVGDFLMDPDRMLAAVQPVKKDPARC